MGKKRGVFGFNGETIYSDVRREPDGGWGCTVWFGSDYPTMVRRYRYATRAQARKACISDDNRTPGWMGVIW